MWISIERDKVRQTLRTNCGVLSYLFDITELRDCKYLNVVDYPIPGDPTATALSSSSISLSWTNTSSILGISIERRTALTDFSEIARGTAGEVSYLDEGLDPGTQYFYRIRYYNGLEKYNVSAEDDATTPGGYGRLYNWYAATDERNICAEGWHISTEDDVIALYTYLGGQTLAGGKLKETGLMYWNSPNTGATNEVGFNGKAAGIRNDIGTFLELNSNLNISISTIIGGAVHWRFALGHSTAYMQVMTSLIKYGLSLRPIKDSTTLTHGQSNFYIDPSGYVYRTICIGTQEWVASNIKTEHFRNGDAIPVVTDNAAWAALSTPGMCSYNNDDNNI